ncbi:MAG: class 1 fructose-bisphosphatase [Mariprofundales bacterium]
MNEQTQKTQTLGMLSAQGARGAEMMPIIQGVARAAEEIAALLRVAVFQNALGVAGSENIQGEQQQKLDILSDELFLNEMRNTGYVCAVGSEERDDLSVIEEYMQKDYVVLVDPLDGSSNLDINGPVGTIFSIVRRLSANSQRPNEADTLQSGRDVLAAGYVLYGPSTMMVCSIGDGVNGFSFNRTNARFELSHPNMSLPQSGGYYSVNESNVSKWNDSISQRFSAMKKDSGLGMRYVGSMVADVHRTLLKGGVFLYPADSKNNNGKLRLLYEGIPMAYLLEQANGIADTGNGAILDVQPEALHQRVPVYLGSKQAVNYFLSD